MTTLESVLTDCYVARVIHPDGEVGYLSFDALGPYLPDLCHAHLFTRVERERKLLCAVIDQLKERGAAVTWLRVNLVNPE